MWQTVFATFAAVALASQSPQFSIGGVVRYDGEPVPGVTVTVSSPQGSRTAVTGLNGEFRVADLPEGPYRVGAALAGFRDQIREVVLIRDATIDFELQAGILVEVLPVVPSLADAFRRSEDIVRLRIEQELPPEPCRKVVTAIHMATVLESIRGPFPTRIRFGLQGAGTCRDRAEWVKGMDQALEAGSEYVVFLYRVGDHFESVGGPSLMFEVEGGKVVTGGFDGLPSRMSLAELYAAAKSRAR